MRESYGLAPEKLHTLIETAVGGLEVSDGVSASEASARKSQEDMNLVSLVTSRVDEGERNLWPLFKKMALSTEYYCDNPHAAWNHDNNSLVRRPKAGSRGGARGRNLHRASFNLFKSSINAIVTRFASTRPQIVIKPGSAQEDVIESARVAQRVVGEYEWEQQGMEEVLSEAVPNLVLHGTTILKTVWNEKGGKYLGNNPVPAIAADGNPIQVQEYNPITGGIEGSTDENGRPRWVNQMGPDGQELLEHEWEGAIETCTVLARDFIVDPTARSYRTARWVIHRYEMSPTDIYDKWGKEVGSGTNADGDQFRGMYGYDRKQEDPARSTTTVHELWLKPGTYKFGPQPGDKKTFDKGFVIICTKDKLIDVGPNPYDHGEFPFVFIPAYRIPGEIYGDTISNSLRMLQNSFNKTGSQITLANDLMGNPQWLLPNGCKMPDEDRNNRAGSYKRYEAGIQGERPEIIPGTGVSPSVWRYFDTLRSLFQEISGVREGGLGGGAPGSIESGKALNALIERDVSKLAGIGMEIGRGLKQWAWLTLMLIQQYWTTPRTVNVVGHYQQTEAVSFGSVDVKDSFGLAVAPESVMPQTQGIKQAKADALLDRGLIRPYEYMRRIGEESAEEFSVEATDISNARAENASARQHGFIAIMSTPEQMDVEDHAIHMEEHRRELLNPALRKEPHKWATLYEHYQLHKELAKTAVQEDATNTADQMAALNPSSIMGDPSQGGPPPTPPGPTPGPQPQLGAV